MWQVESSREIAAPAGSVWRRYMDPATWSERAHEPWRRGSVEAWRKPLIG